MKKGARTPASPRSQLRLGAGRASCGGLFRSRRRRPSRARWLITGNEAAGYGALRGGVRFVAAYPITPATELLEWLAPALAKVGGTLVQAEDELASINMILGASFGGVPSLTATSGPGPLADDRGARPRRRRGSAGRGGGRDARRPLDRHRDQERAGRPQHRALRTARRRAARRRRAELDRRLPRRHAVGGAASPRRCRCPRSCSPTSTSARRARWSIRPQAAALERPSATAVAAAGAGRTSATRSPTSGISPMAIPGTPGAAYTADGLEHNERGTPSSQAADHLAQLDKRARKLAQLDPGDAGRASRARARSRRHLRLVHRARARSARARARRGHEGAPGVAAPARAGAARAPGARARGREARAGGRAEPQRPVPSATCAPSTTCPAR